MRKVLLINAKQPFGHSKGDYNQALHNIALAFFTENTNWEVSETILENGYDVEKEVEKLAQADLIIYQAPLWWMNLPWTSKKYFDEVLTAGHGVLYASDGRSRTSDALYGSGGLLNNTRYMLSMTMNAPLDAFEKEGQFFEQAGVDGAMMSFHKTWQFLGLKSIESFVAFDVMKMPKIEEDKLNYQLHLQKIIKDF